MNVRDLPSADAVTEHLRKYGLPAETPTYNQVKVGPVNYYASTGTIMIDGEPRRRPHRGMDALFEVLAEHSYQVQDANPGRNTKGKVTPLRSAGRVSQD